MVDLFKNFTFEAAKIFSTSLLHQIFHNKKEAAKVLGGIILFLNGFNAWGVDSFNEFDDLKVDFFNKNL